MDDKLKQYKELLLIANDVISECEYSLTKIYNSRVAEAIDRWNEVSRKVYELEKETEKNKEIDGTEGLKMPEKLKPCPFCGGEVEIVGHNNANPFMIFCENCGLEFGIEKEYHWWAVKAWNRRVSDGKT